jgi:fibronectin type 3 domain-containing protein
MIRRNLTFFVLVLILSMNLYAQDWELYAISGDVVSGETFVMLTWPASDKFESFNIYRKDNAGDPYPEKPINKQPVSVMTDCKKIKKIIPTSSTEWMVLTNALADSNGIFDPCQVSAVPNGSQSRERLKALAYTYWKIGIVIGQAYADSNVSVGEKYWYEIRGVDNAGKEAEILDTDVEIEAGDIKILESPENVSAEAGDSKIQVNWSEVERALGYEIQRKCDNKSPVKINESIVFFRCRTNLAGDTISEINCFIDYQRWDSLGNPMKYEVNSDSIYGPYNFTTYYYRIRALDLLKRPGNWSAWGNGVTPQDQTSPAVPFDVNVVAHEDGLRVDWYRVTHDVLGHFELEGIEGYMVYRFNSADSFEDSVQVSGLIPDILFDTLSVHPFFKDTSSSLRSEYGEKQYWYRVRSVDGSGNVSDLSSAAGGYLPDTTPPPPPINLEAEGHANYIEIEWEKPISSPPDLSGYMIYRSICDCGELGGDSVRADSACIDSVFVPEEEKWVCNKWKYELGFQHYEIKPLKAIDDPDSLCYNDGKISEQSPLCYAYMVKAYDISQNLSDASDIVCQRLKEETPPPPPVISSLKARNQFIRIEWAAPPVQDLFGFVVERSQTGSDPWIQISDSLKFPKVVECDSIPDENNWVANKTYSFVDSTMTPKKTYWYRIRAADYGGNIGDASAAIETYTFNIDGPPEPYNLLVSQPAGKYELKITWEPAYDTNYLGFIVSRSDRSDGVYRQISRFIKGNEFNDKSVIPDEEYWYKIQCFGKDGNRSSVSDSEKGKVNP